MLSRGSSSEELRLTSSFLDGEVNEFINSRAAIKVETLTGCWLVIKPSP